MARVSRRGPIVPLPPDSALCVLGMYSCFLEYLTAVDAVTITFPIVIPATVVTVSSAPLSVEGHGYLYLRSS